ncbi:MAG: sulfatase-like hydrolase/transferase, partial [Pseudomonadota bacterium]
PYAGTPESWMHRLRAAGVETTSIGKLHFRSGEDDNGWSEEILPMHVVGGVGWAAGLLRENPPAFHQAAELAADVGAGPSSYTDYDRAITAATEAWLAARGPAPWCAFVSLVSPHFPLTAPAEFYGMYDPAEMPLPIAYDPEARANHPEIKHLTGLFDYDIHFDQQKLREAKAAYFGLTSFMDHCVGRVLAALEASGQADETLVLYTSDHGEMLGDHGLWTKQVMYEASAGVPMILAGPGIAAGRRVATPCSLVDVAPLAAESFGIAPDPAWPGRSLCEIALAPDDLGRTGFSEYHDGGSSTGTFMVRWAGWKYVHYVGQTPQLFHLETDPDELVDLAGDPAAAEAVAEGARRLREICDPDEVNARAFADQERRIAALGGERACREAYIFNHTPTPDEQKKLEGSAL